MRGHGAGVGSVNHSMEKWNAFKPRRLEVCRRVVDAADTLEMLAEAFRKHSISKEAWLDREANRLLGLYEADCKKRKERQGVEGDEEQHPCAKIREIRTITAEKEKIEAERSKLKDEVETLKLALETERAALETERAATAALRSTFETDMACQICLTTPRNVVLLPCSHGQFCSACIMEHRKTRNSCPTCRGEIEKTQPSL